MVRSGKGGSAVMTPGGRPRSHEIGLYFAASIEASCYLVTPGGPYKGSESTAALTFAWFTPAELSKVQVRPSFLASELSLSKKSVRHIVHQGKNAL